MSSPDLLRVIIAHSLWIATVQFEASSLGNTNLENQSRKDLVSIRKLAKERIVSLLYQLLRISNELTSE